MVEILGAVVQLDALPVSLVHKKHKLVLIVQRAHRISNNDNYDNIYIYPAAESVNRRSERAKKKALVTGPFRGRFFQTGLGSRIVAVVILKLSARAAGVALTHLACERFR